MMETNSENAGNIKNASSIESFEVFLTDECDRGEFTKFIEESGINSLLIEAICELNEHPEKPDDPLEWLRRFFRREAPNRSGEIENQKTKLKQEIVETKSKLTSLKETENERTKYLDTLQRQFNVLQENGSKMPQEKGTKIQEKGSKKFQEKGSKKFQEKVEIDFDRYKNDDENNIQSTVVITISDDNQ